jgi:hypothetical protein
MSEFLEKLPLSGVEKHHNFQVILCHHFVTTNVDFAYIESEIMSIISEKSDIFKILIGLIKR